MDLNKIDPIDFAHDEELKRKGHMAFRKAFKKLDAVDENFYSQPFKQLMQTRESLLAEMEDLNRRIGNDKRDYNELELLADTYSHYLLDRIDGEKKIRQNAGSMEARTSPIINPITSSQFQVSAGNVETRPLSSSRSYRGMFYGDEQAGLDKGGFQSWNEILSVAASRRHDPRLDQCQKRAQQLTIGVEGGLAAPDYHAGWLQDGSLSLELIRNLAQVIPLKGASNTFCMWDNQTQNNSIYGGFTGAWLPEGGEADIETAKVRSVNFTPHKLAIYVEATREVLADALDFQGQLTAALTRSVAYLLDEAFISGNGAGRPLGIIHSPSRIDVARATPNTVSYSDLYSMFAALHPSAENAVWLASLSTLPQLLTLKDASNNLIFLPASFQGISAPLPGSIFGKKLIFTDKLPVLGSRADLVLCDPSVGYLIGMREEVIVESSNAPGWERDVTSFRVILRADASSTFSRPIVMRDGNLASWCVCLN